MTLGERLVIIRKEKGYSQEKLSAISGVSKKTIGRWERGETMPAIADIASLSKVLEVPLGYLLGETVVNETISKQEEVAIAQEDARVPVENEEIPTTLLPPTYSCRKRCWGGLRHPHESPCRAAAHG